MIEIGREYVRRTFRGQLVEAVEDCWERWREVGDDKMVWKLSWLVRPGNSWLVQGD